jgi:peptidoglycan/LPS O-acetylase OafA/YrhL
MQRSEATGKKEPHPTAYLDALRGYAALIVFFYHSFPIPSLWVFQNIFFFRVLFRGGPGMVAIFFVISGYVLSYRMLVMIHNREPAKLLDCIASSTFRRWFRLYGSTGVATFIAMASTQLGWFRPHGAKRKNTLHEQLWDWFNDWLYSSDPFAHLQGWIRGSAFGSRYLYQMWTIPVEFRGSMVVFLFCAASCKLSIRSRWAALWMVVLLSYYWRAVYVAEFLAGTFIADLSLLRHPERVGKLLPQAETGTGEKQPSPRWWRGHALASKLGCILMLTVGVFLLSQPDDPDTNPEIPYPWPYLLQFVPSWYGEAMYTFWTSIGAVLFILALDNYPALQVPFNWTFSQYLGDLSFGIYCMHILVLEGLFLPILNPWRERSLGQGYVACFVVEVFATACVLFMADHFTRADKMVVRLGRWLQRRTFQKW